MVRFEAKTGRLEKLGRIFPERIEELEKIFGDPTNIYLDFASSVERLMEDSEKKVFLFATARRVSPELHETGVPIFDIQKIRNFICRADEIEEEVKKQIV